MDYQNKRRKPVNIYWEDIPSKENAIRDVLSSEDYQIPGKVLNSTSVEVEGKPWLKYGASQCKKSKRKSAQLKVSPVKTDIKNNPHLAKATLRDLRKEDKQKVANLIKELAKFGEEKENAFAMLKEATAEYDAKINTYELERQDAIRRYDELKEKLLEYEIQIKVDQGINADGNLKSNNMSKTHSQLENNFEDIFLEQQIKFKKQQQILQQQIEQLQKLQESILLRKDHDDYDQQVLQPSNVNEIPQKTEVRFEDSSRLESKSSKSPKVHQDTQTSSSPTKLVTESNTIASQQKTGNCLECSVSTPKDACIQTENFSSDMASMLGSQRLLQCEKSISLLEQSINSMSAKSNSRCNNFKDNVEIVPILTKSSNHDNSKPFTQMKSILATSEKNASSKKKAKQKNSVDMIEFLLNEQTSSESEEDLPSSAFPSPLINSSSRQFTSSAVERKHYQPSSMMDLVEGLQPRSTSTSIDQLSVHKSNLVNPSSLRKSSRHDKSGRKKIQFEQRRLGKIYGIQNVNKTKTNEDEMDEEDVLEAVFFL